MVLKRASELIKDGYVNHWSIDGLPGATTFESTNHRKKYYAAGFPMGFVNPDDGISYLYNHVMLVIRYHKEKGSSNENTIVGFEVYPKVLVMKNVLVLPRIFKITLLFRDIKKMENWMMKELLFLILILFIGEKIILLIMIQDGNYIMKMNLMGLIFMSIGYHLLIHLF